jgi:2-hydroxy-3-oxopropionate reductase
MPADRETPDVDAGRPRLGFIGLGVMGKPMALNLLRAGYSMTVHSRSRPPVDELVAAGAHPADTPRDVAAASDVVITMLPDTPDVESVILGTEGVAEAPRGGTVVIDMSTINPVGARRIGAALAERGVAFVDAPVSGGQRGAEEAKLSIMVGASEADFERVLPVLRHLGSNIVRIGEVGAGQVAKACNQLIVAANIEAVAEALTLARRAGADPASVRSALLGGFAQSRILEVHGQRMLDGNFQPGFRARLHLKDARIILALASEVGLDLDGFRPVADRLQRLVDEGLGDLDHSALIRLEAETG